MHKKVLITGTGDVASRLAMRLAKRDYSVCFLSRKKGSKNSFLWDIENRLIDEAALENVSYMVHLAGANVMDRRWSAGRKRDILSSRVDTAELLREALQKNNQRIKAFVSASAVGYYGAVTTEKIYAEDDARGEDFLSEVCARWEAAADAFAEQADRIVKVRIGLALSPQGGALAKLKGPIRYGLGATLGSGRQYMPWIHIDDLCDLIRYAMEQESMHGAFNAVAPQHIIHNDFVGAVARSLRRPLFLPAVPAVLVRMMLGERAPMLLEGSRISAQKIKDAGFVFTYPRLEEALASL